MSKLTVKTANADAEAVIEEFLDALEAKSIDRLLNVWHENGVLIMPFSPEGFLTRIEGRKAIRNHYGSLPTKCKFMCYPDRAFYFTNDPNRVWVEFCGKIKIKATGKSYNNAHVCLFTLRDGRIIEYKEYSNPIILMNSFGSPEVPRK